MATLDGAKRADVFTIEPERLTLTKEGLLYDERAALPINEGLVKSILKSGVRTPLQVRKNGPNIEIIDGRQRYKAACEANRRLRGEDWEGEPIGPIKVQVIVQHGSDKDIFSSFIIGNGFRTEEDPVALARKANVMASLGATLEEIATDFGITERTLKDWLKLTDLSPEVQEAIQTGEISAGAGQALLQMRKEEQADALALMKEEAEKEGKKVTVNQAERTVAKLAPNAKPAPPRVKTRRDFMSRLDQICATPLSEMSERDRYWFECLEWALGIDDDDDGNPFGPANIQATPPKGTPPPAAQAKSPSGRAPSTVPAPTPAGRSAPPPPRANGRAAEAHI